MPDEKKGRIALIKNEAGKKSVPREEKHEQETDRRRNRNAQRGAVSIVPVIRGADHERCQKQHRKGYASYTTEFHATNSSCVATKILVEQFR